MKKTLKHIDAGSKEGFTLVEILIVIMIVGMLSVLAISGYTQYRRTALVNLAADSITAQFFELRSKTLHGSFDSERFDEITEYLEAGETGVLVDDDIVDAKCLGVELVKKNASTVVNDNFTVNIMSWEFLNQKSWQNQEWVYAGCADFSDGEIGKSMELDENVFVEELSVYDNESAVWELVNDVFYLSFVPPEGKFVLSKDGTVLDEGYTQFKMLIRYGLNDNIQYKREVIFDLESSTSTFNSVE